MKNKHDKTVLLAKSKLNRVDKMIIIVWTIRETTRNSLGTLNSKS